MRDTEPSQTDEATALKSQFETVTYPPQMQGDNIGIVEIADYISDDDERDIRYTPVTGPTFNLALPTMRRLANSEFKF